jgi:catechol 2,3-dioxygenase
LAKTRANSTAIFGGQFGPFDGSDIWGIVYGMSATHLPEGTHPGRVHLRIASLDRTLGFYQGLLGFKAVGGPRSGTSLSVEQGGPPLIELAEDRDAAPRPLRATGLYHLAIRYPHRRDLAHAFQRLLRADYPIEGASDHGVSEAIYLSDPEGNGVELYTDRPRSQWRWSGGQVEMGTGALDMASLLSTIGREEVPTDVPSQTNLGHVHLHVPNLALAEQFFHDWLGLDVTQRSYPGALFFSAGGYHHHVAVNTWAGKAAPPPNSVGLISYRLEIPSKEALDSLHERLPLFGLEGKKSQNGDGELLSVRDPSGALIELHSPAVPAPVRKDASNPMLAKR